MKIRLIRVIRVLKLFFKRLVQTIDADAWHSVNKQEFGLKKMK